VQTLWRFGTANAQPHVREIGIWVTPNMANDTQDPRTFVDLTGLLSFESAGTGSPTIFGTIIYVSSWNRNKSDEDKAIYDSGLEAHII
jgi:uncharacterized membrane protein